TDPEGRRLGFAGGAYRGDAILPLVLPESGTYRVQLADAAFRGGGDFAYRLEVATRPIVAFIWPPAGPPGTELEYTLYGYGLPGGEPVAGASPLQQRSVNIALD